VHWLRCVLAEWQLLRSRLVRSRLGIWLLLLGAGGVWLAARGGPLPVLAPHVAMLGAVLGVAFTAASDADRAALSLILTHPTTPLAVAAGRWLAAVTAAGTLVLALLFVSGALSSEPAGLLVRAGAAACGAAAAAAGCALVAGAAGGNTLAGVLFLYIAVPSVVSADVLATAPAASVVARVGALALELLPGVWRYAALARGDPVGWVHAACWAVGGVAGTARLLSRRAM
jgi:hypothetical protein